MPSDIEVTEQSAKVLVTDLDSVSSTLSSAYLCVQIYVRSDCSGGIFLTNAGSTLNSVRDQLGDQYRDLSTKTSDAATTVLAIWKDFETRDAQAREKFAQIAAQGTPSAFPGPAGAGPSDNPLDHGVLYDGKIYFPPAAITSHPQPGPATPQVDPVSLGGRVTHPQTDDGWISTLDAWDGIKDRIDEIIDYGWLTGPLEKVGIHTYLDQFAHYMEGNYDEWAQGLGAVEALGSYFAQLSTDLGQSRDQLASHWYGEASTAIQTWLDHLAGASSTHATALNLWSSQIADEAIECKLLLDQVLDLLGDLADLVPVIEINGDSLIEKGLSLLSGAAEAALKAVYAAVKLVAKMVTRFELLYDLCWTFIDLLSHSGKSLDFPAVSNPTPPVTGFDEAAWRSELRELLRRHRDPDLHDAVWSHLEGRTTRRELRRAPAYRAAIATFYTERFAELSRAGVDFAAIRREVARRMEADEAATGPDPAVGGPP